MKAKRKSAGILLYRYRGKVIEFFLVHYGGPFWANKDAGTWSIPKGEPNGDEQPLHTAIREFEEETGKKVSGRFLELTPIIQKAGKMVYAWALEDDIDAETIKSNTYRIEWPPKSGKWQSYPEIDKAGWFDTQKAKEKINQAQIAFIDELMGKLSQTISP